MIQYFLYKPFALRFDLKFQPVPWHPTFQQPSKATVPVLLKFDI